jgi:hypothetical protein
LPRVLSDLTVYTSKTTDVLKEPGTPYHLEAPRFITVGNQEWTVQRNWQHWEHKTQDEDKTKQQKHNT